MCATVKCKGQCGRSMASCSLVNGLCWSCRDKANKVVPTPPQPNQVVTPPNTINDVYHTH